MFKKLLVFLCRRPKADPSVCSRARSVLIRPLSPALGDGIMTTAALAQLKEALPGVRTGVIVNERNRDLFSLCPLADELVRGMEAGQPDEPQAGDTKNGQIYIPGFGWVQNNGGGGSGTVAEDMYENGNKIGIMD